MQYCLNKTPISGVGTQYTVEREWVDEQFSNKGKEKPLNISQALSYVLQTVKNRGHYLKFPVSN